MNAVTTGSSTDLLCSCIRCDKQSARLYVSVGRSHLKLVAARVECQECGFKTPDFDVGTLDKCRQRAIDYWNNEMPRIRLRYLERQMATVFQKVQEGRLLERQLALPL